MELIRKLGIRGIVNPWILALLSKGEKSGYEIMKEIERITGGEWKPTTGTLYPALKGLERKGLIRKSRVGKRGKILYTLTKEGKRIISNFRRKIKSSKQFYLRRIVDTFIWSDEPDELRELADQLITKLVAIRNFSEKKKYKENEIKKVLRKLRRAIEVLEVGD